jgi:hypothetical protein
MIEVNIVTSEMIKTTEGHKIQIPRKRPLTVKIVAKTNAATEANNRKIAAIQG